MTAPLNRADLAMDQLVRYEALFVLLEEMQQLSDIHQIARRAATQWKYFAGLANWRLVLAHDGAFLVIDATSDAARIAHVPSLSPWDQAHWELGRPVLRRAGAETDPVAVPPPLQAAVGAELLVLPLHRAGRCVALLTVAARRPPLGELDKKFIRLFGGHLADRLGGILLQAKSTQDWIDRATHDRLTGLFNRGAILDHLTSQLALARRTGRPVGVILADIDHFKAINDHHGHLAGDTVLRELARRLMARTRDGNGLGRYGGEEFLFVLYPCNPQELAAAAERFRCAVSEAPFGAMGRTGEDLAVTISLGTASSEGMDSLTGDALLNLADEALYRSKAAGRNRVTDSRAP